MTIEFALFDTSIGRCGIAWGARGIVGIQLPERRETQTRERLLERFPNAREALPPAAVGMATERIATLLRGDASDLSAIVLDMDRVPAFNRRVYEAARAVPPGATISYGEIAARLGDRGAARAVGQALGRNPFAIVVPCHRVLAAGGKVGGFSANGGIVTKLRLLAIEGPHTGDRHDLFDGDGAFGFDPKTAIEHLRRSDAALAGLIDRAGPFRMKLDRTPTTFIALAEAIVYQQLTAKAAATIFARVSALFPHRHLGFTAEQIVRISDERLRGAGLSRPKLLSLRDLAERTVAGSVPTLAEIRRMDDESIIERLSEIRGIGRWTVQMILMFRFGRPDVLPADDYGVRKGLGLMLGKRDVPARDAVEKRGARWKPYRTVASWYLWRAVELARA